MKTLIGIRREDKNPWERRVPLIPSHVRELVQNYPLEIWVQPSKLRVFPDENFAREGAKVQEDLSPCKVIFAIKEIPLNFFRRGQVYVFFSHTTKGQPHNMPMLRKMAELGCTLVDYEKIVNEKGQRLLFFGKQAGLAGMIDTLSAFGRRLDYEKKKNPFSAIKQAYQYMNLVEAKEEIDLIGWKIHKHGLNRYLVPLVFAFTGYGHVSQGAQEIFNLLPFEEVEPERIAYFFKEKNYSAARVYKVVFKEKDMVKPVSQGQEFELQDYYDHPEKYRSIFDSYLPYLAVLANCIYWTPKYPRFVTKKSLTKLYRMRKKPRLRVIGDISCDIQGSVEVTVRATDPENPVYVYDPIRDKVKDGIKGRGVVVMAIDNLPAEIPLESSVYFSSALKPFVSGIATADFSGDFRDLKLPDSIKKAVILFQGKLTPHYEYIKEFIK
jgi:alpha-aminoadipic semialdehyde synthase